MQSNPDGGPDGKILRREDFVKSGSDEEEPIQTVEYDGFRFGQMLRSDPELIALLNRRAQAGWRLRAIVDGDLAIFEKEHPIV